MAEADAAQDEGPAPSARDIAVPDLEDWFSDGRRVPLRLPGGDDVHLFCRTEGGSGPWTTLLHGFPTCSWDFAPMLGHLSRGDVAEDPRRRRIVPDLLGFGDSDKPRGHRYRILEQVELMVRLWDRLGVDRTFVVAHDLGVSLAQEMLARVGEGSWDGPDLTGVVLMNGGLFASRTRPIPVQALLEHRLTGWLVARLATRRTFDRGMRRIFSKQHPPADAELDAMWAGMVRRGGRGVVHRLARYPEERRTYERRWTRALRDSPVPLRFLWGLQDPVSGAHVLEGVSEVRPADEIVAWDDVGHYPQVEVPQRVAVEVVEMEERVG